MKITKALSIAILAGSFLLTTNTQAQEKEVEKEVEETKEMADKVVKQQEEEMTVVDNMDNDQQPVAMDPSKTIVENASASADHSTLVAAVKAAGLVETLAGEGPFTVFAPTNDAFASLPEGTVDNLLKPENKEKLQNVLTYHVVAGEYSAEKLGALIAENDGKARLETVAGGSLTAWSQDGKIYISDENGNEAEVTAADLKQSNGVIHVINKVVLPGVPK